MLEDVTRRLGWEPCSCVMSRAGKAFSGGRPGAPTCWIDGCVWRLRPSGSRPLIVCFRSAPDSRDGFSLGPSAGGGLPPGFVPEHKKILTVQPVFVSTATEMVFPPSGAAWKVCFSFETFSCCFVLERVKTSNLLLFLRLSILFFFPHDFGFCFGRKTNLLHVLDAALLHFVFLLCFLQSEALRSYRVKHKKWCKEQCCQPIFRFELKNLSSSGFLWEFHILNQRSW